MHVRYLCVFSVCLLLSAEIVSAQEGPQRDFSKVEVKTQKIADALYMLSGAGGNVGVSVGEDGVAIVDSDFKQMSEKIDAAIKKLSDKPLRYLIDTHWHLDHAGGNAYFQKQGAIIVAQENCRKVMAAGTIRNGANYPPFPKEALPTLTFGDRASIFLNGEEIRMTYGPHAHSDDDIIVYFASSKVLHMGDLYRTDGFPIGDLDNGGSVKGLIALLDSTMQSYPPDTKVIPGHGPLTTVADMRPFVEMLRDTRARVAKGIQQGKSLDQLKQEKVLAGYESYAHQVSMDRFTEELYRELIWPNAAPTH